MECSRGHRDAPGTLAPAAARPTQANSNRPRDRRDCRPETSSAVPPATTCLVAHHMVSAIGQERQEEQQNEASRERDPPDRLATAQRPRRSISIHAAAAHNQDRQDPATTAWRPMSRNACQSHRPAPPPNAARQSIAWCRFPVARLARNAAGNQHKVRNDDVRNRYSRRSVTMKNSLYVQRKDDEQLQFHASARNHSQK